MDSTCCQPAKKLPNEETLLNPSPGDGVTKMSSLQWVIVGAVTLFCLVSDMNYGQIGAFLPDYAIDEKGLTQTWMGFFLAAQIFGTLISTVSTPWVVKSIFGGSNLKVLVTGSLTSATFTVCMMVAGLTYGATFGALIILFRMLTGFGDGFAQTSGLAYCIRTVPEKHIATVAGMIEGLRALGLLIGPFAGGFLFDAGGFYLPFLVSGCIQSVVALSIFFVGVVFAGDQSRPPKHEEKASFSKLLCHPPSIAILVCLGLALLYFSAMEPGLQVYLAAAPYYLDPGSVGTVFGITAVSNVLFAGFSGPIAGIIGQLQTLLCGFALLLAGCFMLAVGPEKLDVVVAGAMLLSGGAYPSFVVGTQLLLRLCRTYDLDPKAYSEHIATACLVTTMVFMGTGAMAAGGILAAVGFRGMFLIFGFMNIALPIILLTGFHPAMVGRPLAPMASDDTDKEEAEKRKKTADELSKKDAA